MSNDNANPTE
jgi:uncharacterized protein (TIGR03083 family)